MNREGPPSPKSRWAWMGPCSFWAVLLTDAASLPALFFLRESLKAPKALPPILWALAVLAMTLIANVCAQTLACFGLFAGGRPRKFALVAIGGGIASLFLILAWVFLMFLHSGMLVLP